MREKEGRRGKNKRKKRSKRLYKSTTNSVLCGVCGGIKKKHIGLIIVISLLFIAAEDLISWMRSYNETAPKGEDMRFYGFDVQQYANDYRYLLEAVQEAGLDTSELEAVWDEDKDSYKQEYSSKELKKIIKGVREQLPAQDAQALHFADIMIQNLEISGEANDNAGYISLRDRLMAENAMWVLDQEKVRGNDCIFIAGHNGHIEQNGSYDKDNKVMGALLADELGDAYFAIGTDFYKTSCNLPKIIRRRFISFSV